MDFRVTTLEENEGNSSVAELEVRMEALEGTATDHETRISAAEVDINGKHFIIRANMGISKTIYRNPQESIALEF